nr:hypothetical protein [Sphingomonas sp. CROZ-RG-20F-R02-07]
MLDIERGLLQLHDRSSALSNLADPTGVAGESAALSREVTAKVVAAAAEIIEDVGEISRQNMLLLEEVVASVRTLQRAHQRRMEPSPKVTLRHRVTLPQFCVLGIAAVIGVLFTAYLIGYVQGFPEGCARGIRDAMAHRAA